jgi:hypothetical protein
VLHEEAAALKYAWAIPDERALRILSSLGPLVEIGCGKGYWSRLLRDRGVDIAAFDIELCPGPERWTALRQGGPEALAECSDRALLLCYPDEESAGPDYGRRGGMAADCLRHYTGDTIVHVGELLFETVCRPSPWGRTTNPTFQMQLAVSFHRVVTVPLPSWPTSRDSLSVWKRTETVVVDEQLFAFVPPAERLEIAVAAPAFMHLM